MNERLWLTRGVTVLEEGHACVGWLSSREPKKKRRQKLKMKAQDRADCINLYKARVLYGFILQ